MPAPTMLHLACMPTLLSTLQASIGLLLLWLLVAWRRRAGQVRVPEDSPLTVLIVGSGFSGLCMAARLRKMGVRFRIVEKNPELGGTWWENTYPGCACDSESHLYSLSFAGNPQWSCSFASQPEILRYLNDVADKHDIRRHIEFGKAVSAATWHDDTRRWTVSLTSGEVLSANILVGATGPLSEPHIPQFAGSARFGGQAFHSARWPHDCHLEEKSVAVVGTGASGVQIVPSIADKVAQLYVFQRTACWVPPKNVYPYSSWFKKLLTVLPLVRHLLRIQLYWMWEHIYWTTIIVRTNGIHANKLTQWMTDHHRSVVSDPVLAERLTPKYHPGCKRITPSDFYLQAFNRNNVTLVTDEIKELTPHGIKTANGTEYKVDIINYATGFDIKRSILRFDVYREAKSGQNRGNKLNTKMSEGMTESNKAKESSHVRSLEEQWGDEPKAYKGITCPGFPNLFFMLGPATANAHSSIVFMSECQAQYIADAITQMLERNVESIEVRQEKLDEFQQWKSQSMRNKVFNFPARCTSWYQNARGVNWTLWPSDLTKYWWITRRAQLSDYHCQQS